MITISASIPLDHPPDNYLPNQPRLKRRGKTLVETLSLILLLSCAAIARALNPDLIGTVKDASGAAIAQATVVLLSAHQSVVATAQTDVEGQFILRGVAPGGYELLVTSPGFAPRRIAIRVTSTEAPKLDITLGLVALAEEITITADVNTVQGRDETPQQVSTINERQIEQRAKTVLAQVANETVGVQLQRTSPTIGGVFIRGLTGNKVSVFVDGVRYSTGAARGGINTFLNLNEASNLRAVEILRGPNSAQFGSDALGGSLQLLSQVPLFTPKGSQLRGRISTAYHSADHSYGGNTQITYGTPSFGFLANLAARRTNTLRPGGGRDTHAAVTRFLGLRSDIFGERLTDTAFTQYGGLWRLNWIVTPAHQLTLHYQRGQQDGGKRYDQTLGGDGNLIADLRNLMLDFFYVRYEKAAAGWFDTLSATYSFNTQREERVNQGGNGDPTGEVSHLYERTNVHGVQLQVVKQWGGRNSLVIGAEFYHDRVTAPAFAANPVTSSVRLIRPRVPNAAVYRSGGIYVQDAWSVIAERLRLVGSLRYSAASYRARAADSPLVGGRPLWPDDSLRVDDVTGRMGAVVTAFPGLNLSFHLSRGFRAPHITDLGTLGLTGSGFEVAAPDVADLGATIGSTADSSAISTGLPVQQLVPETSWSYDAGIHLRRSYIDVDVVFFVNDINDNIAKQALILPPGAVGKSLGGQLIIAQNPNGVVFVAASTAPVLVRTNFDRARYHGIEQTLDLRLSPAWTLSNTFTYIRAEDRRTGLPPNIEGGTPAPIGWLRLRYEPPGGHFWIEPYLYATGRQARLSSLDLEDRRTGAFRSRNSISRFFFNGATARGLVGPGGDGKFGTADDVLLATGETLTQIQDRVLGPGVSGAPLFRAIPGFLTLNLRGGFRLGEKHEVTIDLENITDRNYRGISWGLDGPGRGIGFRYSYRF
jgi:hemoglobin/transferrin/lactoferrin receptor protein